MYERIERDKRKKREKLKMETRTYLGTEITRGLSLRESRVKSIDGGFKWWGNAGSLTLVGLSDQLKSRELYFNPP